MSERQRIFVGDVQGCSEELDELIRRAHDRFGQDSEIWLVGDLVNRGPKNLEVLRQVRELVEAGRGRVVLGNHDLNLLRVAAGLRSMSWLDTFNDVLESPDLDDWFDWLRGLPLMLRSTLGGQDFAMVHAAVHPDWSLDELERRTRRAEARLGDGSRADAESFLGADPGTDPDLDTLSCVTSCRSVNAMGNWKSSPPNEIDPDFVPWHVEWSVRNHGYGIVYGHWSLQGLHVAPWLRGLDTGCVHHGRGRRGLLTAWSPPPDEAEPFLSSSDHFWHIHARRAYYARRDAEPLKNDLLGENSD